MRHNVMPTALVCMKFLWRYIVVRIFVWIFVLFVKNHQRGNAEKVLSYQQRHLILNLYSRVEQICVSSLFLLVYMFCILGSFAIVHLFG